MAIKTTRRFVVTVHWMQFPSSTAAQFKMKGEADHYVGNVKQHATKRGYTSHSNTTPVGKVTTISDTKGRPVVVITERVKFLTPVSAETRNRIAAEAAARRAKQLRPRTTA